MNLIIWSTSYCTFIDLEKSDDKVELWRGRHNQYTPVSLESEIQYHRERFEQFFGRSAVDKRSVK